MKTAVRLDKKEVPGVIRVDEAELKQHQSGIVSDLNQKIYGTIVEWQNRPITESFPYVFLDGIWLKRAWGGEVRNVAVLVAIGVNSEGFCEILGVCEGTKEDSARGLAFLRHIKQRGLQGVKLMISDKCLGLIESLGKVFPHALWQRCVVHCCRNVLRAVLNGKAREVALMLKASHAQDDSAAALEKATAVSSKLDEMKRGSCHGYADGGTP